MYTGQFTNVVAILEASEQVKKIQLPVKRESLSPVFSKDAIDLHYGVLYKNYVDKSLKTGDKFQTAGAILHSLFFEQFQESDLNNSPYGEIKTLLEKHFGGFSNFKEEFIEQALTLQGAGWIYLTNKGQIKLIHNHVAVTDAILIIDMWEHSYLLDYGSDKEKYLKNVWKIIDWNVVNNRLD